MTHRHFFSNILIFQFVTFMKNFKKSILAVMTLSLITLMSACAPKEMELKGVEEVEGQLSDILTLEHKSYTISFDEKDKGYVAVAELEINVSGARDYAEINLTASILDREDDPLCNLAISGSSSREALISQLRGGSGSVELKFTSLAAEEELSKDDIKKIAEKGVRIQITASEGNLAKTPEQIKAEQDSIARASVPAIEISDLLEPKRKEEGFTGKVRDVKGIDAIVAALQQKGFTVASTKSRQEYSEIFGEYHTITTKTLNRMVGDMPESVQIESGMINEININFCDTQAALDFMTKMTADGYKNGTSSDCYYAGSYVERKGNKVRLYQIWEP